MPQKHSTISNRFRIQPIRQHVCRLNLDYQRLEPRQLLAAVQGQVSASAIQHDPHNLDYGYVSSTQAGDGRDHNLQPNDHVHSSPSSRFSQPTSSPAQRTESIKDSFLNNRNESNARAVPNGLQSQVPTLRSTLVTSNSNLSTATVTPTPRSFATTLISNLPRVVIGADVKNSPLISLLNPIFSIYGPVDRSSTNDANDDSNQLRQLFIPLSNSETEMLISGIESEELDPNRLDEFFAALKLDEVSAATPDSDLTSDSSLLTVIGRERKSLNGILSELIELTPFDSADEATETDNIRMRNEEFRDPSIDSNAPKVSAASATEERETAFDLAKIADGGIVMLGAEKMTAVDQIDWMIDFVAGNQEMADASANCSQIEMSVGIVQAFDLGRRETQSDIEEITSATSTAE